jgi:cellulose synthase/poly-beta-1,6-N-acetylglucosamine synthase-like glycosyltransferase
MLLPSIAFWLSSALLFFTFAGYGLLMKALARRRQRPLSSPDTNASLPAVCVILSVHNGESGIVARLENLLSADYPAEKLRVLIVSDGSTDSTITRIHALHSKRIEVIVLPARAGKSNALNAAFERCTSEIAVLTDARQRFAPEAITHLVRHFSDPSIGAVSGSLEISPAASTTGAGVDAYWRYEKSLRAAESRFDSCIGCTGAIYAVRRALFTPIPADTLLDDVVIPMQIAATGARVIHDPEALAFDPQPLEPAAERRRKQRTLAGGFQMLFRHPAWLLPWGHRLWWQLIAHKYLRLLAPLFLATTLISNLILTAHPFYAASLGVQGLFYLCAALGSLPDARRTRPLALPAAFVFLNLQTLRGLLYFLSGAGRAGWK